MKLDIQKHYPYAIGGAIIVVSILVRIFSYPVISTDYVASLSHWMDALRGHPGLSAFQNPFSDYSPLYLYALKGIALLPGYDLYWIKTLSLIFDIALASLAVLIVRQATANRYGRGWYFAVVVSLPTIVINSSMWGQNDSIYASFILLCLYFIMRDKPLHAAVSFGLAFSIKLQAMFFAPLLVGYFLYKRRASWPCLFAIPVIYILTLLPAAAAGGSFLGLFFTYVRQAGEFKDLTLSAPSVFSFFSSSLPVILQGILSAIGYICAIVVAIFVIRAEAPRTVQRDTATKSAAEKMLCLALFSVLAIPFFLPHMHERYFYLADALSVIVAFSIPRYWFLPMLIVSASFFSYMPFLSPQVPLFSQSILPESVLGISMLAALICLALIIRASYGSFTAILWPWKSSFETGSGTSMNSKNPDAHISS